MTRKLGMISAVINISAVAVFALSMPLGFHFGDYLSSIFIALSFVMLICTLATMGKKETNTAGVIAMVFAGIYAGINLLVYFTQVTTVRLTTLTGQAASLLDFQAFGLFFNYDLLGYCLMALATFFIGLTIEAYTKADKVLKWLLLIHGVFAIACFIMPIMGVFYPGMEGGELIGTVVLEFWCLYFLPVGVLSFRYFRRGAFASTES